MKKKKKKEDSIREILINNIIDMTRDEFETPDDWINLAKKSHRELVFEIIYLARYFRNQNNSIKYGKEKKRDT
jgi:hypothetical protein